MTHASGGIIVPGSPVQAPVPFPPDLPHPVPAEGSPEGRPTMGPQLGGAAGHQCVGSGPKGGGGGRGFGPGNWQPARAPSGAPARRASSLAATECVLFFHCGFLRTALAGIFGGRAATPAPRRAHKDFEAQRYEGI